MQGNSVRSDRASLPPMPPRRDLVVSMGRSILEAGEPLDRHLSSPESFAALVKRHGWLASAAQGLEMDSMREAFRGAFQDARVRGLVEEASATPETDAKGVAARLLDTLAEIPEEIARRVSTVPVPAAFPFDRPEFWKEFPRELVDELVVDSFALHHPPHYAPLVLHGLFVDEIVNAGAIPGRAAYSRRRVRWDRLRDRLTR